MIDDFERCYRAVASRDARFDGWFVVGVVTTGIYCRPSCPAMTPRRSSVRFFRTSAAAQQCGLRACKRCRPDASPGSPEWNARADTVARAMRLVADGVVDREGVGGLARRLGYSVRQLNRLVTAELGVGPLAVARAQRAHTARVLIETTELPVTDVAFAAGFGSVRQFNDTIRDVFAMTPRELRARGRAAPGRGAPADPAQLRAVLPGWLSLRLAVREPFDAPSLFGFLAARAVPGCEHGDAETYSRALDLPHGQGVVTLRPEVPGAVRAELRVDDWRDITPAVQRCRRLLDLDADPVAIDGVLAGDAVLAPLVARTPGLRAPGAVCGTEVAVRAVVNQQVSVVATRTILGRLVGAAGTPLVHPHAALTHAFPSAAALAEIDPAVLPMPDRRRQTLRALCAELATGSIDLDPGADRSAVWPALRLVPGVGPWTAGYVVMRALGDPDVFLPEDAGVRRALDRLGCDVAAAERWRPWRSYAVHRLWASLGGRSSSPERASRPAMPGRERPAARRSVTN